MRGKILVSVCWEPIRLWRLTRWRPQERTTIVDATTYFWFCFENKRTKRSIKETPCAFHIQDKKMDAMESKGESVRHVWMGCECAEVWVAVGAAPAWMSTQPQFERLDASPSSSLFHSFQNRFWLSTEICILSTAHCHVKRSLLQVLTNLFRQTLGYPTTPPSSTQGCGLSRQFCRRRFSVWASGKLSH